MSAQNTGQRVFILVIVAVFFLTAVGTTAAVIYQSIKGDDASVTQSNAAQTAQQSQTPQEGKLEGTKLENFTPVAQVTELQKIDIKEGTGEVVPAGATVTAHYTGALAKDGTIFQSSKDMGQPIPFGLNQVIAGWTEGVPGMKVGGIRRLVIPAAQAYGAQSPSPNIPANSDLVFDIEIVKLGQ